MEKDLELLEKVILLAKKHKVDVIKYDKLEILITRHDQEIPSQEDKVTTDREPSEEELLFHSSNE